ncbi:sensor histidine kinase [Variovorax sp. LT1P1]|uniref:sensor histidine kinase n=1 Tax=Variovorax sp. LT1P1 TaxID=3443730 RepID=UPI003F4793A2
MRMLRGLWLAVVLAIAPASANAEDDRHIVPIRHVTLHDLDNGGTQAITQLPARRLLEPRGFRRFGLEADFELVDRSVAPLWALYHRQLSDGARVRINGVIVGDVPTSTPRTAVLNVRPFMFVVPVELLRDGRNRLEMEWATHDSIQHVAAAFVGPADVVRAAYERRLFWQNTMAQVGLDFALVNAAILMGIYALRRHELRYLLMGLTALSWANVCFAYLLPSMPAALYPYWHLARLIGIAGVAGCCWAVLWLETEPRHPFFGRLCFAWAAVGPAWYVFNLWVHDTTDSNALEAYWGGTLVALGLYPLARLARLLMRRWNWRRGVYLLAALAGMLAGSADLAMSATGASVFGPIGYSAQAISPLWFTAMVAVLVKDFADFLVGQRHQNELMARKLGEQQAALQRLYDLDQQRERERAALQERRRIMRDMHDGLGSQLVSSLALSERGALDASQTSALLRECIDDLRLAIDSLAGSDDGFAVMAGNLRFRMEPRLRAAGIVLRWNSAGLDAHDTVDAAKALSLLRVMQESLSNAMRHSGATEIAVTLATIDGRLSIEIRDNGTGFDVAQVRRGQGLQSIEKRTRTIGAALHIAHGGGTTVRVTL